MNLEIMDRDEKIMECLGEEEILLQLAEECSELAKAALKLRRVLDGRNPTPKTEEEARADLIEEVADIWCVLDVLLDEAQTDASWVISMQKGDRWLSRLEDNLQRKQAESRQENVLEG